MLWLYILCVVISCLWIMKACDPFEDSADYLGRNLSSGIKGATINAVASSIPEFLTTFIFLFFFHDKAGFESGIATTAGSAVFNAMVIPALCIFSVLLFLKNAKFHLDPKVILRDGIFLLTAEGILIYLLAQSRLSWWHGAIMVLIYAVYAGFMLLQHKLGYIEDEDDEDDEDEEEDAIYGSRFLDFLTFKYKAMLCGDKEFTDGKAWVALSLAVGNIALACYLLSWSVVSMADYFNMNTFFVAVIVAAAATSVPDTIISMKDAKKGNYDDAVANAVGSNIFDICVCLGFPLMMYCLVYGPLDLANSVGVTELRIILFVLSVIVILLFLFVPLKGKTGYLIASILLGGYLFYAAYSWSRGMNAAWANALGDKVSILAQALMR